MISSFICRNISFWKVAFFDAAKRGDVDEVDRLINGGADVNQTDKTASQENRYIIYTYCIYFYNYSVHTYIHTYIHTR